MSIITLHYKHIWLPNVKFLWIVVKFHRHLQKNKCDCQSWYTKGTIDLKEHIWLTGLTYLRLSFTLLMYYTHVYTVSKVSGINTENKICL